MLTRVSQIMKDMTRAEQQVAAAFLREPHDFAFFTLDRIAKSIGTSTTSVLRFCRFLGFEGYRDFQEALQQELKSSMTLPKKQQKNRQTGADQLLERVITDGIRAIRQTFEELPEKSLSEAASLLANASRVFTFGLRESYALSHYAYTRLTTVRPEVHLLEGAAGGMMEPLMDLQKGDVCLCFLFHRYTELTLRILPLLKQQKAAVILVTDRPFDAVIPYADLILPCHVSNNGIKNTALAPICICDYFCNALALQDGESIRQRLTRTEALLSETAVLSDGPEETGKL